MMEQESSQQKAIKQKPAERHFSRKLRNKPCPCGATKEVALKMIGYNTDKPIRGFLSNCIIADEFDDTPIPKIEVPIKAKNCCLRRVEESYHSTLEKYVKNEGKRNWPKEITNVQTN